MTEGEYAMRRQMIIQLQDGTEAQPGEGYRTWAWIVGLPGFVITGAGFMLAPVADPAIWIAIAIGGSVMMAVSGACAIVASTKRKEATERR